MSGVITRKFDGIPGFGTSDPDVLVFLYSTRNDRTVDIGDARKMVDKIDELRKSEEIGTNRKPEDVGVLYDLRELWFYAIENRPPAEVTHDDVFHDVSEPALRDGPLTEWGYVKDVEAFLHWRRGLSGMQVRRHMLGRQISAGPKEGRVFVTFINVDQLIANPDDPKFTDVLDKIIETMKSGGRTPRQILVLDPKLVGSTDADADAHGSEDSHRAFRDWLRKHGLEPNTDENSNVSRTSNIEVYFGMPDVSIPFEH